MIPVSQLGSWAPSRGFGDWTEFWRILDILLKKNWEEEKKKKKAEQEKKKKENK